jgi:hypothetical protein
MLKPKEKAQSIIEEVGNLMYKLNKPLDVYNLHILCIERVNAFKVVLYEVSIIDDKTVNKTINYYNEVISEINDYFNKNFNNGKES